MQSKAVSANIWELPASGIRTSPYQPRKRFDTTSIAELADSILKYGVLQPIIVRRLRGGNYELVTGERRLRAVRLLGLKTIPAVVVSGTDDDCAAMALIENVQRKELNFFEEAQAYNQLVTEHGLSEEKVAELTGRKESVILQKLRLLRLSDALRKEICNKKLSEEHAAALLKFPDEEERMRALEEMAVEEHMIKEPKPPCESAENKVTYANRVEITGDNRIYINTIDKAIDLIRNAGATTGTRKRDYRDRTEYVITIMKR